jgi:hypothetical protein
LIARLQGVFVFPGFQIKPKSGNPNSESILSTHHFSLLITAYTSNFIYSSLHPSPFTLHPSPFTLHFLPFTKLIVLAKTYPELTFSKPALNFR